MDLRARGALAILRAANAPPVVPEVAALAAEVARSTRGSEELVEAARLLRIGEIVAR